VKWIVRRRTCMAAILSMKSTAALQGLAPHSWKAKNSLLHRRTVILFNELHSRTDGLPFQLWLADQTLWSISEPWNIARDDESTAIIFLSRITSQIWERIVHEWRNVIDQCSEHIRSSVNIVSKTLFLIYANLAQEIKSA
jgi:hypothetical protein